MAHATARAIETVPPAEVEDVELYHAQSWWTRYVFCQDAKVIAIQYSITALAIGLVALVLSWLMRLQLGFPDTFSIIDCDPVLPVHHHARHDHGDLPAHRAVPRRLRQLPDPADGRRPGHGVPLCQHAELLDLPARGAGAGDRLLRAGRADRRRLDPLSAPGDPVRHPGRRLGHHHDAPVAHPVHHRLHDGRVELCRDRAAGAHARDDADAPALDGVGDLHGHRPGAAGLSRPCSSPP